MADNLPPSSADVTESGSRNIPEPSGPHRPVMDYLTFLKIFKEYTKLTVLHSPLLSDIRKGIVFGRYAGFRHICLSGTRNVYMKVI
jgi:hypothetical protein